MATDTLEPPSMPVAPVSSPQAAPEAPIKGAIDLSVAARTHVLDDNRERALKPGSSRNKAFDDLDSRAGIKKTEKPKQPAPEVKNDTDTKAPSDKRSEKADSRPDDAVEGVGDDSSERDDGDDVPEVSKSDNTKTEVNTKNDSKPNEGKKPNPWRLADEWKKKAQDAEKKIKELETTPREDPEKVTLKQQLAEQVKREKELSDELKFYNYEAHDKDFKAQFDEPYIEAWHKAVSEIAQFPVALENDQVRAGTDKDLWKLMNLPRLEAREEAEAMFGKYADDVLGEVSKVRDRFEARTKALTVAKKTIGERQAQRQQQMETAQNEQKAQVTKLWEDANKYALEHPKYGELFRPVEGDQEGNLRLAKGKEMVERAFNEDPNAPNLTPSQRSEIVKRHAMIFHRAVAFGRAVAQRNAAMAKLAAIEKELASFKASVPGEGEGRVSRENGEKKVEGMAGALSMLDRLAR